jgi:hypothetical protein
VIVNRFPVRDAMPQAHDWTLHEHVRGLVALLDARAGGATVCAPTPGDRTGGIDEMAERADAVDVGRMDSDLG